PGQAPDNSQEILRLVAGLDGVQAEGADAAVLCGERLPGVVAERPRDAIMQRLLHQAFKADGMKQRLAGVGVVALAGAAVPLGLGYRLSAPGEVLVWIGVRVEVWIVGIRVGHVSLRMT